MKISIALGIAATMALSHPAAAQPLLCGGLDDEQPDARPHVAVQTLVGTFRCAEEGLTITLRLDADGRFEQRFEQSPAPSSEAERRDLAEASQVGRWRVEDGILHLFERPQRAPTIELVATTRDPSVWMRVEVRDAAGRPATGLFVGEGRDANPQSQLDDGVLSVPKSYRWEPGLRKIVRQGDDLTLASFTPTRDGANVFRFVYRPSEVEPFAIRARVMDAAGTMIGVPMGIGGALLRRVTPAE